MPDTEIAAEFERVCRLFRLAVGRPSDRVLFDSLMGEASALGKNWVQGLEYVIEKRLAARDLEVEVPGGRKGPQRVEAFRERGAGELVKAG